jgi:hypothetical protein
MTYKGAFIDESHFGAANPTEFWRNLRRAKGKGETTLLPLQQYSPGFRFSGRYIVDIPDTISNNELAGVGTGIWLDYQKRYEGWQYRIYPAIMGVRLGTHSAFETADIPSTYLGYVAAVKGITYEAIVAYLGGGRSSKVPPPGHRQGSLGTWIDSCDIEDCISGQCPEDSPRNDTIFLKAKDVTGKYRLLPYPSSIYIAPVNKYWRFDASWTDLYIKDVYTPQ